VLFADKLDGKVNGMLIALLRIGEVAAKMAGFWNRRRICVDGFDLPHR
jgi:hypothetical protein